MGTKLHGDFPLCCQRTKRHTKFECGTAAVDEGNGAVYNDLKEKNVLLELEQQITFSQMSEETINVDDLRQVDTNDIVPQEAVEKSILEPDNTEALLYNDLCFESELLNSKRHLTDSAYSEKVYKILAFDWENIFKEMSGRVFEIYQMPRRIDWTGSRLIVNDYKRHGFPYIFPFWEKVRRECSSEKEIDSEQDEVGEFSKFIRDIVPKATGLPTKNIYSQQPVYGNNCHKQGR